MRKIWSIYKKELRSYFNSPIAYILITILLIGVGYFFFQTFFLVGQASLRSFFSYSALAFILFGPAITMRLFAEERKAGTIEPLLTLPVKEWRIVVGKFLAGWTLLLVYLLLTLAYPISISFVGKLDTGPVIGGYLGLLLLGGVYVALGLFTSAVTRNQVVSLVLAFFVGLLLYLLDLLLPFIPESLQNLVAYIGIDTHFKSIARGVIDRRDIVYYISLTIFLLFITVQAVQARFSNRSANWRINKLIYLLSAAGALVAINIASQLAPARLDLTEDQRYTLSEPSAAIFAKVSDRLTVKAYFSKNLPPPFNNHANYLRDLLEEFRQAAPDYFHYEFIDPGAPGKDEQAQKALQEEVRAAGIPQIEVQKLEKDQLQAVKVYMGIALTYKDRNETIQVLDSIDDLEYKLVSRLAKLTREKTPRLGFLTGHGELSSKEGAANALKVMEDKFEVIDVNLEQDPAALDGLDILIVAGPQQTVPDNQLFLLDQFIMGGGKAAFMLNRVAVDMNTGIGRPLDTGLEKLLERYGVTVQSSLVLDQYNLQVPMSQGRGNVRIQSMVPFPPFIQVRQVPKDNPLVDKLDGIVFPFSSPLQLAAREGLETAVLLTSSDKTWLMENTDSFLIDPQMLPIPMEYLAPQTLAATLVGEFDSYYRDHPIPNDPKSGSPVSQTPLIKSPKTRLAVAGSPLWFADMLPERMVARGYFLFANILDWLIKDEQLMNVRAKVIDQQPLQQDLQESAKQTIRYGNMFALPLAFVLFGVIRWRIRLRRKRRGRS